MDRYEAVRLIEVATTSYLTVVGSLTASVSAGPKSHDEQSVSSTRREIGRWNWEAGLPRARCAIRGSGGDRSCS